MAELEQTLAYPEFLEWIAYFRLKSGCGSAQSVPHWQKMIQSMRLVTELQRAKQ